MKLALYGGSFDPPHAGHVAVVTKALEVLSVDKVIIVPAWRNPFKPSVVADGAFRYEWLKEIFAPLEKVEISDFEITQEKSVYTIETVKHYTTQCDEIYLIIGADNLEKLPTWHSFDELNTMVHWVVAARSDIPIPENMIRLTINAPISSSDFRASGSPLGLEANIEQKITTYYKEHL
ncbi:nicotinate (nicotinamide) nucleotide adenylyltransferase [Sulfuricurvum sp. RIFCSPLOWO2_12_FULL_43_24]|uniref:nicotinate (nicotinamide) nucleotide adenylyltransferase n=1 Tax=Sulfuricurvum sp. RIFCSPLOWO2_12_FULL_43_24 TaxID=1802247 RepID=UPI0008BE541B|nr:nicotinate (nicotinamide) nucleotide adenylyltransferase [Sulfuricurvum sp. RIFCSPLOWO2_12_FULL_43_24]OHD84331.1 MAG: nicotinate (nicotinamide) nucleotide adenylyltransferase [Sulfuricurvum sp. RIFCSPHIGHO2_02_FULL_43_9]OHD89620.1 MAG: nicotinate (nicotinamide) nucleotide adenylyltransferase [Sulfuricurvum sp. RIFCSPLOWO2_12_FULL_43_24]